MDGLDSMEKAMERSFLGARAPPEGPTNLGAVHELPDMGMGSFGTGAAVKASCVSQYLMELCPAALHRVD